MKEGLWAPAAGHLPGCCGTASLGLGAASANCPGLGKVEAVPPKVHFEITTCKRSTRLMCRRCNCGPWFPLLDSSMAADESSSSPPNILLIEQNLILKYLRRIYLAWAEAPPVVILFASFFELQWRQIQSEKSNQSMAPEQFYFINAKFRITEIHHFFLSLMLGEENSLL